MQKFDVTFTNCGNENNYYGDIPTLRISITVEAKNIFEAVKTAEESMLQMEYNMDDMFYCCQVLQLETL